MLDSKQRFSKTTKYYDLYRPSYPRSLVNWILKHTKLKPGSTIVDIGCGTGNSTRLFTNRGFTVIGIDPNPDMLAIARKQNSATFHQGEAADTKLPLHSADLLIMAQALHWFDISPTLNEFQRILNPSGWCCAFWNARNPKTKFIQNYDNLINQYSHEYAKTPKPAENVRRIKASPQIKSCVEKKFINSQILDLPGLIGRAYSTSYIAHGVTQHSQFKQKLTNLFHQHKRHNHITFHYYTFLICWQFT